MIKKILHTTLWFSSFLVLILLLGFTEKSLREIPYKQMKISVDTRNETFFVNTDDIEKAIRNMGIDEGQIHLRSINIRSLEDFFNRYPSVRKSQVFSSIDGTLHIHVEQRTPVLRVYSRNGDSYYIDKDGKLMPLSTKYTSRVMVLNGFFDAPFSQMYPFLYNTEAQIDANEKNKKLLQDAFEINEIIRNDAFLHAQFSQLYYNSDGDFELIPRVGNHKIVLGKNIDTREKFEKLKIFYIEGLQKTGWNTYESINLKFKDQVVCTKKSAV
jgi:cell division protein FtsQ